MMQSGLRRGAEMPVAALVLGAAESASASGIYFDMLTSTQMHGLADSHLVAEFEVAPDGSWDPLGMELTAGAGLGDGLVTSSDPLEYVHEIRSGLEIESAFLFLWTADDAYRDAVEQVTLELDGSLFAEGPAGGAWAGRIFAGTLEVSLLSDAALRVVVSETLGGPGDRDLVVRASALSVRHSAPIPEPAPALLFAVGGLIAGATVRRRA